jgi:hypothetical protein
MITRYDSLIEFLQDIHSIKNAIVCVTDGFVKEANMLPNDQYHTLKEIMKKNNIKVLEMKGNVKSNFKVK